MHPFSFDFQRRTQRGIVLPMALIMLVIISFAGLLAARNSATFSQFSNNMRTNQVARVAAEEALRYCERIAIASAGTTGGFATDVGKIVPTVIANDTVAAISAAAWNTKLNWKTGAANLITVNPVYGSQVYNGTDANDPNRNAQLKKPPSCIVQNMTTGRFLITSRGLSSDAVVNATTGLLTEGSEVWLQSILTPSIPVQCAQGGSC